MVNLRFAVLSPVVFEVDVAARIAKVQETGEVPDRRIEPDVEIFVFRVRDAESELGRIAGNIPILQSRAEPLF